MKTALTVGARTLMLHRGKITLDIAGQQRQAMQVSDLLDTFSKLANQPIDSDRLLLER